MNEMNKSIDNNSEISLNSEFSNSVNVISLAQRGKTNQGTKESDFDDELVFEKINLYLISKQYKETIKFIESKEELLEEHSFNYIFFDLKLKCFYKILKNELSKYKYRNKNIEYSPTMKISITLEKMFQKMKSYFKNIIKVFYLEAANEKAKEILIQNYCEGLYLLAKFHKIKNQTQDASSYLSISHSMLKTYIDKCKDPYTYQVYQKILILLSTLLIEDNCYYNAIEYNFHCLKLCIKELFIRNTLEKGINLHSMPYKIRNYFREIFQNINLSLYLLGICYENLGQLSKALDCYKQASWFISKFYHESNSKLFEIIQGTEIIAFKLYDLIMEKIRNRDSEQEKLEKENKKKILDYERLKQLNKISAGLIYNVDKFPVSNYIENKIQLFQSGEPITISSYNYEYLYKSEKEKENFPSPSTIKMIDNVVLYNGLLSIKYQKFINNIKDLNFNNINKDNFDELERYNRHLMIEKNKELERKKKNLNQNFDKNLNNSQNLSQNNNYKLLSPTNSLRSIKSFNRKKSDDFFFFKKKRNKNERNDKLDKSSNSNSTRALSSKRLNISKGNYQFEKVEKSQSTKNKNSILNNKNKTNIKYSIPKKVERFPLSKSFIFNKNFKKKIEFLEKINNREIKFQKNILYLKKLESKILKDIENESDCTVRAINKADFSFNLIKEKIYKKYKKPKLLFDNLPENKIDPIDKVNLEKIKLQDNLIAGLNPKKLELLKNLDKNIEIMRNEQFTKLLHTNNNNNNSKQKKDNIKEKELDLKNFEKKIKNVSNVNNNIISTLDKEINNFKKKEKFLYQFKK